MYPYMHLLFSQDVRIQPFMLRHVFTIINIVLTIHRMETGLLAFWAALSGNGSIDRQHNLHRSYAHERMSGGRLCHCNAMARDPKWPSLSRNSSAGPVTDIHNFAKQTRRSQAPSGLAALGQTRGEQLMQDVNGVRGTLQVVGFRHAHVGLGP
jgi:hypothetical protein